MKSLIKEGKQIEELLKFLESSYTDHVPVGGVATFLPERKQKRGESVRDYAVDLEKRFLRLQRRTLGIHKSGNHPGGAFLEGIEDLTCGTPCETCMNLNHLLIQRNKGVCDKAGAAGRSKV